MDAIRTVLLTRGSADDKRREIRHYFNRTFTLYERLFDCLAGDEAFYARPEMLRHPLIFYFGHTAVFYVNKLNEAGLTREQPLPELEAMLAVGVDEMSWDDLDQSHYDWPAVADLRRYRDAVRDLVNRHIDTLPLTMPIGWDDPFWVVMMGIEHERIHLETSSVLIRQLPMSMVRPRPEWPCCDLDPAQVPPAVWVPVAGRSVELGKGHPSPFYGWDNEYGRCPVDVAAFEMQDRLVSNADFLAFVEAGGYRDQQWWSTEGWGWRCFTEAAHPTFWVPRGDGFATRAMTHESGFRGSWPVDVNFHEAAAYAAWLSDKSGHPLRLPTEAEWRAAYDSVFTHDYPDHAFGAAAIGLERWASSEPVTTHKHGPFYDLIGNVWQWTDTTIDGFEGFRVHPTYDDFSTPTFDGRHNIIKGGSWATTGNEQLHDSRYAFRRHFFQHAGLRLVRS